MHDGRAFEQVSALIKGEPKSEVRLSIRTPIRAAGDLDQNSMVESTIMMNNDETVKYEKRWAERFNNVIRESRKDAAGCGSSGWGDSIPFVRTMQMSVTDHWNDMYLAHAYPFLYARKLQFAFANHTWERFLLAYGKMGLHIFVLIFLTLLIVGGYRTLARCDRFARTNSTLGVFATQVRPKRSMPLYLPLNPQASEFCNMQCALHKRRRWT